MLQSQKDFLLEMTTLEKKWIIHDNVMLYRRSGRRKELKAVDILESVCNQLLTANKTYPDPRARLALCNIVLQRIQASVPLSQGLQAELNNRLFPAERFETDCVSQNAEADCFSQNAETDCFSQNAETDCFSQNAEADCFSQNTHAEANQPKDCSNHDDERSEGEPGHRDDKGNASYQHNQK